MKRKHILIFIIISFIFLPNVCAETYSLGTTSTMTGKIIVWSSNTIPSGYLLCDGRAVSRTTYADLFKIIGTTYGAGDGSTTYNLPDMQNKVVISSGSGASVGSSGGQATSSLTSANLPAHTHSVPALSGSAATAGAHQHYIDKANSNARTITIGNKNNNVSNIDEERKWEHGYGFIFCNDCWYAGWKKGRTQKVASAGAHPHSVTTKASTTGSTGSGASFSVQNPYIAENYIIKY